MAKLESNNHKKETKDTSPEKHDRESAKLLGVLSASAERKLSMEKVSGALGSYEVVDADRALQELDATETNILFRSIDSLYNLSPEQERRDKQIDIIVMALNTILNDIKLGKTPDEKYGQRFERKATTEKRAQDVEDMIVSIYENDLHLMVRAYPETSLNDLLEKYCPKVKEFLRTELQDRTITSNGQFMPEKEMIQLVGRDGKLKEAYDDDELNRQYSVLLNYFSRRRDYDSYRALVEDTLLAKEFAEQRALIEDQPYEGPNGIKEGKKWKLTNKIFFRSEAQIIAAEAVKSHREQVISEAEARKGEKLTPKEIELALADFKKRVEDNVYIRGINGVIAKKFDGIPFDLEGSRKNFMYDYRKTMGNGPWWAPSAKTLDMIADEVAVNLPLILISGGAAAGARWVGVSLATKVFRAGKVAVELEKIGYTARAAKLASSATALAWDSAAFTAVHNKLQGRDFFSPGFIHDWVWTALTIGAFKGSHSNIAKAVERKLVKMADDPALSFIQKSAMYGSSDTATLFVVNMAQHYDAHGSWEGFDPKQAALRAAVTAGAFTVVGSVKEPIFEFAGKKIKAASRSIGYMKEARAKLAEGKDLTAEDLLGISKESPGLFKALALKMKTLPLNEAQVTEVLRNISKNGASPRKSLFGLFLMAKTRFGQAEIRKIRAKNDPEFKELGLQDAMFGIFTTAGIAELFYGAVSGSAPKVAATLDAGLGTFGIGAGLLGFAIMDALMARSESKWMPNPPTLSLARWLYRIPVRSALKAGKKSDFYKDGFDRIATELDARIREGFEGLTGQTITTIAEANATAIAKLIEIQKNAKGSQTREINTYVADVIARGTALHNALTADRPNAGDINTAATRLSDAISANTALKQLPPVTYGKGLARILRLVAALGGVALMVSAFMPDKEKKKKKLQKKRKKKTGKVSATDSNFGKDAEGVPSPFAPQPTPPNKLAPGRSSNPGASSGVYSDELDRLLNEE